MKTNRANSIYLIISVIVIVCAVYWQSLLLPFIQDDWGLLSLFQTNDSITLLKHFLDYENKLLYRPLAQGYLLLIYKLFGPKPIPFHVMALIVHVVNSYIISLIINIIICDRLISNLTALVYAAAIPIHLDSLAWVVGINDVGGAFFFFTCIFLFLKNKPIISAIFYFFGFFVKESLIPLPILLFSYPLLINSTAKLKETILNNWKQTIPFLIAMGIVLTIKLSGISPFDLPTTHPYVIDLMGVHVIKNILIYPVWMFQSLLPFLSFKKYSYQFGMVLLLLYGILVVFRLRKEESQFRRIFFFLVWLLIGLLPVLFLPNHTYRYYATYSLPAFIGSFFFLIKCLFLSFDFKRKAIVAILISISFFAVFGSILQGNQVYRNKLYQNTLSDGTNGLIRKAALVDIVCKGLKQYLPIAQSNSTIVIGNVDLWSFHKDNGPQFWYNDSTIRVYALRNLKYKEGKWYIENPIQNRLQAKTRPIIKKIFLNPSMLFVYKVSNEKLIRIDLGELIYQSERS